jgi:hypothetical protein
VGLLEYKVSQVHRVFQVLMQAKEPQVAKEYRASMAVKEPQVHRVFQVPMQAKEPRVLRELQELMVLTVLMEGQVHKEP